MTTSITQASADEDHDQGVARRISANRDHIAKYKAKFAALGICVTDEFILMLAGTTPIDPRPRCIRSAEGDVQP